jgi:hypothetical protein
MQPTDNKSPNRSAGSKPANSKPAPKRSLKVPLILMGAVGGAIALPFLFSEDEVQRNQYNSIEDCIADYSDKDCLPDSTPPDSTTTDASASALAGATANADGSTTPATVASTTTGSGYHPSVFFYGPWYRSNWSGSNDARDPGPGRFLRSGGSPSAMGFSSGSRSSFHGPAGTSYGSRGGFGHSGSVHASSSS